LVEASKMGYQLTEQTAKAVGPLEREVFKAELRGGAIRLCGAWPRSDTAEGIRARTDIAIALVKKGYLNYEHPGAGSQFTVASYPIQIGCGRTYKPGEPFKLTWLNDAQLDAEFAE